MKHIYSLRDSKAEAYLPPFFLDSKGLALRTIGDAVNRPQQANPVADHPEDFALFFLGLFDELTGAIVPEPQPVHIVNCLELKDQK